jgi:hypothetical protein
MSHVATELVQHALEGNDQWRKKYFLNAALGSDGNEGNYNGNGFKTLAAAYAKLETLKNDAIILEASASAVSLAADPAWTKSLCGLVGTAQNRMNQRSRIGMSTAFTPMMTLSGYGNLFENLYIMHGTSVDDHTLALISGNYNTFRNINFATPMFAAQANDASYLGVSITGTGNFFQNCVFGMNTIARTGAYPTVKINAPTTKYGYTRFDNCDFIMQGDTAPFHMLIDNTAADQDEVFVELNDCRFISTGQNMPAGPTYSFSFTVADHLGCTAGVFLNPGCQFVNCGIVHADNYGNMWVPTTGVQGIAATAGKSVIMS